MSLCPFSFRKWLLLVLAASPLPVHAADLDRCLPPDTQVVVTINVQSFLRSPLGQGQVSERIRTAFVPRDPGTVSLASFGIDPFRDVSQLVYTSPGGADPARGLVIVHGRFDQAAFHARAGDLVADRGVEAVPVRDLPAIRGGRLWHPFAPEGARLDRPGRFLHAGGRAILDDVGVVLEVVAGKRQQDLNRTVQDLIARANGNQTVWVVEVGNAPLLRAAGNQRVARDMVAGIETVSGGLTPAATLRASSSSSSGTVTPPRSLPGRSTCACEDCCSFWTSAASLWTRPWRVPCGPCTASVRDRTVVLNCRLSPAAVEYVLQKSL